MEKTKSFDAKKVGEFALNYALYIILGLMLVVIVIMEPSFLSVRNILNILTQASTRGFLALGVAGLIVLAGTDLSIGRIVGCCAAVSASLLQSVDYASKFYPELTTELPLFVPLILSILVGVVFAAINGFGVAVLKMHAFVITLGTQLIAYGVCCIYIGTQKNGIQPIGSLAPHYTNFVNGKFLGIPNLVILFALACVVMWFVWNKTTLGKNMFAIGGNMEAAAVSGVNITKNIMMVFVVAGVLYGIASFLEAGRVGSVTTNTGLNYETDAISACVIGGVSFSGGVGTIPGVVVGVLILQVINYALNFLSVNPYLQYVIKGLIIIVAVAIDVRKYLAKK